MLLSVRLLDGSHPQEAGKDHDQDSVTMSHVELFSKLDEKLETSGVHSLTSRSSKMMPSRVASSPSPSGRAIRQLFSTKHAAADILDSWRNPAAMLHGANDLLLEDTPLPDQVAEGLVRVQMRSVGICGSDVHFMKHVSHLTVCTTDDAAVHT